MAVVNLEYDNVKDTLPKSTAVSEVEADYLSMNRVRVSLAGSPSESNPPDATSYFTEGDYFVDLANDFVSRIKRVIPGDQLELVDYHGLSATGVTVRVIKYSPIPSSVSWSIDTAGGATIDGIDYPASFISGGAGFRDYPKPFIVDATGTTVWAKLST